LLALLTPQGYAKCQMLIFHHSSKTNELYETSKVRLKRHLFPLSYPGLDFVCPCGSSLLLVTMQTTNSPHRN